MKLKYAYLFNVNMLSAMRKLMACGDFELKVAYRVAKIAEAIDRESKTARPLMQQIEEKFKESPESAKKKQEELFAIETVLPYEPIAMESLSKAMLSPQELLSIEWLLEV